MMRYTFWSFLLFTSLTTAELAAQNPTRPARETGPGRVVGTVVNEAGAPLAGAAVSLLAMGDTAGTAALAQTFTSDLGRFRLDGIPLGRYRLRITFIGHAPLTTDEIVLTAAAPAADLGTLRLTPEAITLAGIEAAAERAPVVLQSDRTVYDAKQTTAAAGNATDVLRSIPELEVDINGNVTMRGGQPVAIHLNDRPAPLKGEALTNFLQQLPGNRIVRVEVVPNPSAKHDPEGTGGIVNIVLAEGADLGLSGSLAVNVSSRMTRGLSGRLNYQRGRFTLFSGGSVNFSDNEFDTYDLRQNLLIDPVMLIEQRGASDDDGLFSMFDLTAELRVGRRGTLWASAWGYGNGADRHGITTYRIGTDLDAAHDHYERETEGEYGFATRDVGIGFKQVFQPQRHELTIDLRQSRFANDADIRLLHHWIVAGGASAEGPSELMLEDRDAENTDTYLQADYVRPLGAEGKLDVGVRVSRRRHGEDALVRVFEAPDAADPREATRTGFRYDETFRSVYATADRRFGKLGVQLGVRAELASTDFTVARTGERFVNDYNSIFPSANISYDFGGGRSIRFAYSKRIGRPWPFILNPDVPATDSLNRYVGNPELQPNYTHSFGLDLSWIGSHGTLRLGPYYRHTVDQWDRIRYVDSLGVSTLTWANVAAIRTYGTTLTASLRPAGRIGGSVSLNGYVEDRDAGNLSREYSRRAFLWSANGNASVRVTDAVSAQANVRYDPPREVIQGRIAGMLFSSFGVRHKLWGNRGSLDLFMNDPFGVFRFRLETRDSTHVQLSRSNFPMRQATLSVTWNFGKPPEQKSRRPEMEQPPQENLPIR